VALAMPITSMSSYNFRSLMVLSAIDGWAQLIAMSLERRRAFLTDPTSRRFLAERAAGDARHAHLSNWSNYLVRQTFTPETGPYEGRMIGEIAATEGRDPFDTMLDIALLDDLRTGFGRYLPPATQDDWELRAEVVRDPGVLIGGSDAGAHLDMISTHNYPTRVLAGFTREQSVMSLEETVHHLSEAPARLYGLRDRGTVAVGVAADLVVFDPDEVGAGPVVPRADLPSGADRLYSEATGIDHVLVNGVTVVDHGTLTGATPGKLLRSGVDLHTGTLFG
jgi:N-acyl-D-aspartate/D-glutamate deacylase